jgi:HD-like signal output (HDOD) protein
VRVAEIVRREPDLVRRVWSRANSAAYARGVVSLDHAIARVGLEGMWRLAMGAAMDSPVFRVPGFQVQVDRVRRVGQVAGELAAPMLPEVQGGLYLGGLLHNVGRMVIYRCGPDRRVGPPPKAPVDQIARRLHAGFGSLVCQAWGLGPRVSAAVAWHVAPRQAPPDQQDWAGAVQVASVAAWTALEGLEGRECGGMEALQRLAPPGLDPAELLLRSATMMKRLR